MAKVAFLGLGRMGSHMGGRLIDAGHDLVVWNRSKEKAEPLAERGARVAATPREAAEGAEVVITMVADDAALRDVVLGTDGVAEGMKAGAVLVDMSTVGPAALRELRDALREGVDLVDAPVLGSVPQAESGELKIFVGSAEGLFERLRPILEAMGAPRRVGELGAGASLKLVVNSTLGAVMAAVGEALALARALGVDEEAALETLEGSYVGGVVKSKRHLIEGQEGEVHFALRLAAKDLRLVTEAAERAGIRLQAAEAIRRIFEEAVEVGLGDADYGAVIPYLRDR
jgi:3-hydroxyisobutyrate dehydrogenase-like beta-hydroxyacid dehydrogenase